MNPARVVRVLNEIHKLDSTVLQALIEHRVSCNEALANHPTVQVAKSDNGEGFIVGMLGILNGFFPTLPDNSGPIRAHFNDTGELLYFSVNPEYNQPQQSLVSI